MRSALSTVESARNLPASGADRGRIYFWTTPEVTALGQLWDEGRGLPALLVALPGRSQSAIEQKAAELQLPKASTASGIRANPEIDELIRKSYADGGRGVVQRLSEQLGVPSWWISRRAGQLGLVKVRLKEPAWSQEELALVLKHGATSAAVAHRELRLAGFDRSVGAVAAKVREVVSRTDDDEAVSARTLALKLGVDEKTVVRWIQLSGLKAARSGAGWRIQRSDARDWIRDHSAALDLKRVEDPVWFIATLAGEPQWNR